MKKILLVLILIISITACSNNVVEVEVDDKVEDHKLEYLDKKNELLGKKEYNSLDDIPCDLVVSIDRVSEEEISYRLILDNPKVNMHDITALFVHNQFTEDIFPSIGVFDDKTKLIVDDEDLKGIELVGYIETTKEFDKLDIEFSLWLNYKDDNDEVHDIYYKIENINYHDKTTKKEVEE